MFLSATKDTEADASWLDFPVVLIFVSHGKLLQKSLKLLLSVFPADLLVVEQLVDLPLLRRASPHLPSVS